MRNSPNLDKFRASHSEAQLRVFLRKADEAGREITVWQSPYILIGRADRGDIIGTRLSAILSARKQNSDRWCHAGEAKRHRDITAAFWATYDRIGRCAFDPAHLLGFMQDEDRFVMDGNVRVCTWCGSRHERRIVQQVRTVEQWAPITDVEALTTPSWLAPPQ